METQTWGFLIVIASFGVLENALGREWDLREGFGLGEALLFMSRKRTFAALAHSGFCWGRMERNERH